ncbi:hypothetical protein WJX72_002963 [[Myrmecia] bisecta]|uniref:Uncharacterized protein n=1 Tax=[Myrmecia] bisecta TaxID=41462 RepID=A0AAW1PGV5_9CHLO
MPSAALVEQLSQLVSWSAKVGMVTVLIYEPSGYVKRSGPQLEKLLLQLCSQHCVNIQVGYSTLQMTRISPFWRQPPVVTSAAAWPGHQLATQAHAKRRQLHGDQSSKSS